MLRAPVVPALLLLSLSCSQKASFYAPQEDTALQDADADADADSDTDVDDGDVDGDGFTEAEGDCDDTDIGVNPARDEDPSDGKDNDCDGRIDEEWSGLVVALQVEGSRSSLALIDTVGRVDEEIVLPADVVPYGVAEGLEGGWVLTATSLFVNISAGTPSFEFDPVQVLTVSEAGESSSLVTFGEDRYDDMMFYWYGPLLTGVKPHPDGYYVAALPGALLRIDPDGSVTELATWAWDLMDDTTYELYAFDIAVNRQTGEVGIQDLLGGFATWTEAGGLVQHKKANLADGWENWDAKIAVGLTAVEGESGWYGMVADYVTGDYALERFESGASDWTAYMTWSNNLVRPLAVTADSDHGDFYVSAKGGDHYTLWRLREEGGLVDDFFDEVEDGVNFWGLTSRY